MNKRIQKKRDMPSVRRAYAAMGLGVGSESQRYCEMVRCRRSMLRRNRRLVRRTAKLLERNRVPWVMVTNSRGPAGRMYMMPKKVADSLNLQLPDDKLTVREIGPLPADLTQWKMYTTKLVQLPGLKSVVAGLIS